MRTTAIIGLVFSLILTSCQSIPEGATPVTPFDVASYQGKWYEIARFDFKYEKDLNQTTADYSLMDCGKVRVVNRGYNTVKEEWKEAKGKAKFRNSSEVGALKVSFFGPFYAGYNVIALEGDYEYALVAGRNTKYMWILSRTPTIPDNVKTKFLNLAEEIGYDTSQLIWVAHK